MKLYGFLNGSGKIGSIVVSKVNGRTIAREYNPNVSNPSTIAQVNQRARMKIAAQLTAVMAPNIAIASKGALSGRNAFIKKNMAFIYATNGQAFVSYENLQLTDGTVSIPGISLDRSSGSSISVGLVESAASAVSRVVYVAYKVTAEKQLQNLGSVVATSAGANGTFPASLPYSDAQVVVYAYGLRDLSADASALYGNYSITNGEDVAKLLANRSVAAANFQATATRGTSLLVGETVTQQLGENECRLFLTAVGSGTVSGAGVKTIGQSVTVVASPGQGAAFLGWKVNGSNDYISSSMSYTFTITGQTDLVAVFEDLPADAVTIDVQTEDASHGLVRIGAFSQNISDYSDEQSASVSEGTVVTVAARPIGNYVFDSWRSGGVVISNNDVYTFTISEDTILEAHFATE